MLERAKANGVLVPLAHYKISVHGASRVGLTPDSWMTLRSFWKMYFEAAGAELVAARRFAAFRMIGRQSSILTSAATLLVQREGARFGEKSGEWFVGDRRACSSRSHRRHPAESC